MKLLLRIRLRQRYSADRFERILAHKKFHYQLLKKQYKIAKPSSAKRLVKRIRKLKDFLNKFYKQI